MDLQNYFQHVEESTRWISERITIKPHIAVVLSGGLGKFAEGLSGVSTISSSDIPHFPSARAEGHAGKIVFGKFKDVPLAALLGRYHYYEGYAPQAIVFPYFVLAKLGTNIVITTNAVGGANPSFRAGDIMLVEDHINMMGINPLIGLAIQREKDQFTDMTEAYDPQLRDIARKVALRLKIDLKCGVYAASSGPSYETKAEVRALRQMGADAVGMSTVPEVIAANFLGLRVLAFSCIANPAAGLCDEGLSHAKVLAAMNAMSLKATQLLRGVVEEIGKT